VSYLIATFDLGPGVDTVLDLYLDDTEHTLLANDDARPGGGLLSVLRWVAPRDGDAILRVGPRTGATQAILPGAPAGAGSYRVAVALARGALAAELEGRIAEQTNAPPAPSAAAKGGGTTAPAAGAGAGALAAPAPQAPAPTTETSDLTAARVVQGDSVKGQATALVTTTIRLRPQPDGEPIEVLAPATIVTLLGKHSNLWVRVQSADAVLDGWVLATDLRRFDPDASEAADPSPAAPADEPPSSATDPPPDAPFSVPQPDTQHESADGLLITRTLPMAPVPEPEAPPASRTIAVTVTLRLAGAAPSTRAATRVTPVPGVPVARQRVQLVNAFGDVLAEALTPEDGQVTFTHAVTSGAGLWVRLPAPGLLVEVSGPRLNIVLPEDQWPR
jgi:hypothetical protein